MVVDMDKALTIYKNKLALQGAQFQLIEHDDAIIATVYKVIASPKKTLILKICSRNEDYFREVYFLKKLKDCLPIPQITQTVDPSKEVCGAILMEYIEGHLTQDTDWSVALAHQIGSTLAHLHNNRTKGYGDLTKPETLAQNPELYFKDKFEEELAECTGHLPQELIEQCKQYYNNHKDLLTKVDGPCMIHRDFRPGNMIIKRGELKGIIDWAGGRSGFAEQDFCLIEHFKWSIDPAYKKALLEGYSSIRHIPNYQRIMPLLHLGRALAVIGYTVASQTWDNRNASLYKFNREFLDNFDFSF